MSAVLTGMEHPLKAGRRTPAGRACRKGALILRARRVAYACSPSYNLVFGHPDFRLVVVTKFAPADYKGFLEAELPDWEQLQPIKVSTEQ